MLLASIENLHCLQVPNGELSASQLRWLGDSIANLEGDGCGDITTRANIQLRGMTLAEADKIFAVLSLSPCECRCACHTWLLSLKQSVDIHHHLCQHSAAQHDSR